MAAPMYDNTDSVKSSMTGVFDAKKFKSRTLNLCRFANGKLKDGDSGQLTSTLLCRSDEDILTQEHRILVSESPHMTYTGQNFGRKCFNFGSKSMKYYVGVFNENTGKMRICDAQLFQMTPYIKGDEEEDTNKPEVKKPTAYADKRSMLTEAFGSKRQKSALEKVRKNRLDEDTIQNQLAADIDHGKQIVKSRLENQVQEKTPSLLDITPPCNKEAENVEDVYNITDILSESELEALHGSSAVMYDSTVEQINAWKLEEKFPKYVLNHIQSMPLEPELRWKRSKYLLYLSYMINLYVKKRQDFKAKDFYPKDCPVLIQKKLNDNFVKTTNKVRCMPSRQKDRLASYILTLCLLMDEFNVNLIDLMLDMGLAREKLFQILKLLGCKINKKSKDDTITYIARLKLPLDFPSKPLFKQRGGQGR